MKHFQLCKSLRALSNVGIGL